MFVPRVYAGEIILAEPVSSMGKKRNRGCCLFLCLSPLLAILAMAVACNLWVIQSTRSRIFESPEQIDNQTVALVLGTSKKVAPNTPNPHFENRINAAVKLYEAGKVGQILVSGYRDSRYYDEAKDMEKRLIEYRIPTSAIMADDKGDSTIDSVERVLSAHYLDKVVIISDGWHVHRALFIADRRGIEAVALASEPVSFRRSAPTRFREYLARVKAVIDLYLIHPKDSSQLARWFKRRVLRQSENSPPPPS